MRVTTVIASAALVVLIFGGIDTTAKTTARKSPKELNVTEPLYILKDAYDDFKEHFDLIKTLVLLIDIVYDCVLPIIVPSELASHSSISHALNVELLLNDSQIQNLLEALPLPDKIPGLQFQDPEPEPFCQTPEFRSIHNFVWKDDDDKQLEDLVHFFGKFGFPTIYTALNAAYTKAQCPPELIDDLPKELPESKVSRMKQSSGSSSNVREQLLQEHRNPRQEEPKCNILEIISKIPETGLMELLNLIQTVTYQFNTNHNLHFLIGKLQEPIKGKSVNQFHNLPAVKGILMNAHQALIKDPTWSQIFTIIKQALNIDFFVINPYEFLFSLFEFILWGTPFPPVL